MSDSDPREERSALTHYGFEWGPMEVPRASIFPDGSRCLIVSTPFGKLDIYASPTGRSLRVWRIGEELRP